MPKGRYEEVMERDRWCQASKHGWTDARCKGHLVVHHIKPKGMGGSRDPFINSMENLVVLCDYHHTDVHSHPQEAYLCGLLARK